MRFRFNGMDDIGELDSILDEEDWNVVTNDIPVAFVCVELYSESSHISYSVLVSDIRIDEAGDMLKGNYGASTRALNSAKADEERCCSRRVCQNRGKSILGGTIVKNFEVSMSASATCMNNALRNTLMIKSMYLFSCNVILQERRTCFGTI